MFFFSLSLALFTDAKLLCLISNSSTFIAREIVNLNSLLDFKSLLFTDVFSLIFLDSG